MYRTAVNMHRPISGASLRCFTTTPRAHIQSNTTILNKFKNDDIEAPLDLAKESTLPHIEQKLLKNDPRQAKMKRPLLSDHKIENDPNYRMSLWKQNIGQMIIRTFLMDMDKSRAGPIAGSLYYGECKKQALYYPNEELSDTAKYYYSTLNLPRSFSQWFQITTLHYWILSVRFRAMPLKYGKNYQQKLVDRYFSDMELRMSQELGINSNRIIEGYLKDYHTQMLGSVLSYDEALVSDDITLAGALWRNVFNGDPNVDMRHIESLVGYVRSQLYVLSKMSDREVGFGKFRFVPPNQVVRPLTAAQLKELREKAKEEFEKHDLPSQRSVLSLDE